MQNGASRNYDTKSVLECCYYQKEGYDIYIRDIDDAAIGISAISRENGL
jgi:hypothetical protein